MSIFKLLLVWSVLLVPSISGVFVVHLQQKSRVPGHVCSASSQRTGLECSPAGGFPENADQRVDSSTSSKNDGEDEAAAAVPDISSVANKQIRGDDLLSSSSEDSPSDTPDEDASELGFRRAPPKGLVRRGDKELAERPADDPPSASQAPAADVESPEKRETDNGSSPIKLKSNLRDLEVVGRGLEGGAEDSEQDADLPTTSPATRGASSTTRGAAALVIPFGRENHPTARPWSSSRSMGSPATTGAPRVTSASEDGAAPTSAPLENNTLQLRRVLEDLRNQTRHDDRAAMVESILGIIRNSDGGKSSSVLSEVRAEKTVRVVRAEKTVSKAAPAVGGEGAPFLRAEKNTTNSTGSRWGAGNTFAPLTESLTKHPFSFFNPRLGALPATMLVEETLLLTAPNGNPGGLNDTVRVPLSESADDDPQAKIVVHRLRKEIMQQRVAEEAELQAAKDARLGAGGTVMDGGLGVVGEPRATATTTEQTTGAIGATGRQRYRCTPGTGRGSSASARQDRRDKMLRDRWGLLRGKCQTMALSLDQSVRYKVCYGDSLVAFDLKTQDQFILGVFDSERSIQPRRSLDPEERGYENPGE